MSEMVGSLRSELREQEYKIRQEVCKEFNEQLIEIEDNHRYQVILTNKSYNVFVVLFS